MSEAFDVDLNLDQAYLIADGPLKVYPLGTVNQKSNWIDRLVDSVAKVRSNDKITVLKSKILGTTQPELPDIMHSLPTLSECM